MATKAFCPSCEEAVTFKGLPKLGLKVQCSHCDADLEVVELSPVELDWAYYDDDDDEEWDDEDWDDEDDDDEEWDDDEL